jgi:DNA-binding transcriptional ArsR family regulator
MHKKMKEYYSARANIIKALANPTRIFIVEELEKGERCVCELRDMIGDDMSTVSKHLSILKNAGFVSDDKRGLKIFYRLTMPCALKFLECSEKILKDRAEHHLLLAGK